LQDAPLRTELERTARSQPKWSVLHVKTALLHPTTVPAQKPSPLVVLGTPWDMRKHPRATLIDHFAGIGGATTGARRSLERVGYKVGESLRIITVNHDPDAVANHALNHPEAEHHCCPLESIEPRLAVLGHACEACRDLVITTPCPVTGHVGERVTVLITCAPCQPYSQANQTVYSRPQFRATPDYSRRWIQILRPLVVLVENVRQIRSKWAGWPAYLRAFDEDGYRHEHRILNAADYGTPQDRQRLILMAIARDYFGDHQPIPWPKKTHSELGREPGTQPWPPVFPCLDFDEPAPSFFEGRKTDGEAYAENVRARIARYLRSRGKFYEPLARAVEDFTGPVPLALALEACPEAEWPSWVARMEDGRIVLTSERFLVHQLPDGQCRGLDEPSYTQLTAGYHRLAEVRFVLPLRGPNGGPFANPAYDPTQRPGHTVLAGKAAGYVGEGRVVFILPRRAALDGSDGAEAYDPASRPSHTVIASNRPGWVGEVEVRMTTEPPVILPHHGEDKKRGQPPRYHETTRPAPTVPASRALDVAFPAIVTYHGRNTDVRSGGEPAPTVATKNQHYAFWPRVDLDACYLDLPYRQITPREAARIQGFDDSLRLTGTVTAMQRGIGNAVPPPLIDACLTSIFQMRGITRPTLHDFGRPTA
jgi:site-specific DNA-cytosine methylase